MPKTYTPKEVMKLLDIDRDLIWLEGKLSSFTGNLNSLYSPYEIIEDIYRVSGRLKDFPDIYSKPIESLNLIQQLIHLYQNQLKKNL